MPDFTFNWLNPKTQFFVGVMLSPGELTDESTGKVRPVNALQIGIFICSFNFLWKAENN